MQTLVYICPCLRWKLNGFTSPFCWCPQRRCCPHYLKSQGQNRPRHCSLKTKSNLKTEEHGRINLIAKGDWEQKEKKKITETEKDFSHASSLSSSLGRVFKEDLVPDWRRRLFAHAFLFLPPGKTNNTHYWYQSCLKIEQTIRKVKNKTCGCRLDTDTLVVLVTGVMYGHWQHCACLKSTIKLNYSFTIKLKD